MAKSDYNRPAKEGWSRDYEEGYKRIFTCDICDGKGYHYGWDGIQKKMLKTTCLICGGTGRRKV